MEIIADSPKQLLNFIANACTNADSRKTANKALDYVLIRNTISATSDAELSISGSNGEQTYTQMNSDSGITADSEFALCIDSVKLFEVVKALHADSVVKIKHVDGKDKATLTCSKTRILIPVIDSTTYPSIEVLSPASHSAISVNASEFSRSVGDVLYAVGKGDVRQYLNGIQLSVNASGLYLNASDGHRLSVTKLSIEKNEDVSFVLPFSAMAVLSRLAANSDELTINYDKNLVEFSWGDVIYRTVQLDTGYPAIGKLFPSKINTCLELKREQAIEALSRMLVVLSESRMPKIKLIPNDGQLSIVTACDEEGGQGEDQVDVRCSGDIEGFEVVINARYLLEAISHMHSQMITMAFQAPDQALCISPNGDGTSRALIMPIKA